MRSCLLSLSRVARVTRSRDQEVTRVWYSSMFLSLSLRLDLVSTAVDKKVKCSTWRIRESWTISPHATNKDITQVIQYYQLYYGKPTSTIWRHRTGSKAAIASSIFGHPCASSLWRTIDNEDGGWSTMVNDHPRTPGWQLQCNCNIAIHFFCVHSSLTFKITSNGEAALGESYQNCHF